MGAKKRARAPRRAGATAKAKAGTMRVTHPGGRVEYVKDTGQTWPPGTMLEWDVTTAGGRKELRWTVTGGGWPFDD